MNDKLGQALPFLLLPPLVLGIILSMAPIGPTDYWWHLAMGKMTAETGSPLFSNLFIYTLPADKLFIDLPWLAEWLMYELYRLGGHNLMKLVTHAIGIGSWAWLMLWSWQREKDIRIVVVLGTLLVTVVFGIYEPRTRLFIILPFIAALWLILACLENRLAPVQLWWLMPLTVLWANMHGSFLLVPLMLAAGGGGKILEYRLREGEFPIGFIGHWVGVLIASAVCVGLHPAGLDEIYRMYINRIVFTEKVASNVTEWQSLTLSRPNQYVIAATILGTVAVLIKNRKSVPLHEFALLGLAIVLELKAVRMALWWAAITLVLLPRHIKQAHRWSWDSDAGVSEKTVRIGWGITCLLSVFLLSVQPGVPGATQRLGMIHEDFIESGEGHGVLQRTNPLELVKILRQEARGCIFHDQRLGGLLEFRLAADSLPSSLRPTVFVDQRMSLPTIPIWEDYWQLSEVQTDWREPLEKWQIGTLLLSKTFDSQPDLIEKIENEPGWTKRGESAEHVLFIKQQAPRECPSSAGPEPRPPDHT